MANDPRSEYGRRLEERRAAVDAVRRKDSPVGSAGLWSVSAVVLTGIAVILGWLHPGWVLIPLVAAVICWSIHVRLDNAARRLDTGVRHYERGLARLEGRWAGTGNHGAAYDAATHPYAQDLDLFGRGSLFELLCTARTRTGEKRLADWLLSGAAPAEIRERQAAVKELRERLGLREELDRLAGDVGAGVNPAELAAWGARPEGLPRGAIRTAARLLTLAVVASLAAWLVFDFGPIPFTAAVLVVWGFSWSLRARVQQAAGPAEEAERELDVLARMIGRLGQEPFEAPRLAAMKTALGEGAARIGELARLVQKLQSARNELVKAVAGLFLWRIHCAFAIEEWRLRWGSEIPRWLDALGDLEALGALAGYSYEHPEDPFPEIRDEGPVFEAEALGHPLLSPAACVRNDVRLGAAPRVLIVSGSNMSGKSTLLRTVGTNAVLALAGAPVRARRLAISPVVIASTIRVQDSLQAGASRFYAEITRIRQMLDLAAGPRPLLFLLEEILHGTNSHDRAIGAEAVVRELLARGAVGFVTTHDLALARAAEALDGVASNVHFEDQVKDGKLAFDYVLRPGTVKKSNALELMRSVGIPVRDPKDLTS